ncbi:MAG: nicotinate-nucleotide--dimethylbenzimidazole phosphoribosyltransferase [Burkholderiales bacterium]|nr:nicotinate-nucleotide--dimethylbenzimidazole phosphoribosyltransferase [Anaerolineae bacterium]
MISLPAIPPLDVDAPQAALARQARLTKPAGALGKLEALSVRLAAMTGRIDWLPTRRAVVVCAGDHGVAAQGVSAYPQAVTQQMVMNFLRGGAAVNVLARQMGARVTIVDAGVAADFEPHPNLIRAKIAPGTADMTLGPAMTLEQADAAVQLGQDVLGAEIERGLDILVVGEMGIGNTTSASAIIAAITDIDASQVTGRGTGIDYAQHAHKVRIVNQALRSNYPARDNTLAKVGGFEIGVMAGLMLCAAAARVPILVDGLICTAAAMIAAQFQPQVVDYMVAAHRSIEPGHGIALSLLGLAPLLEFDMRLGEGTGALLALPIVEAAMRTLQEMSTFDDAGVSGPV